jgi:hypothetical protein
MSSAALAVAWHLPATSPPCTRPLRSEPRTEAMLRGRHNAEQLSSGKTAHFPGSCQPDRVKGVSWVRQPGRRWQSRWKEGDRSDCRPLVQPSTGRQAGGTEPGVTSRSSPSRSARSNRRPRPPSNSKYRTLPSSHHRYYPSTTPLAPPTSPTATRFTSSCGTPGASFSPHPI